jgi:glycosyltransferase involved in cell wall biosynthesis
MEQLPSLSLCMIVRDEEEHLTRCLSSVSRFVNEIIIVDTGSSDQSKAIALSYGAVVIEFKWNGDFSEARNAGLRKAKNPWILVLDADEEWANADISALCTLLERAELFGCYVQMISYIGADEGEEFVTDAVCRLFRNDPRITFSGRIHEEISPSIKAVPGAVVEYAPITIKHYGYLDSVIRKKRKTERNLSLLCDIVNKYPEDLRMQYALGTEYFQIGDYTRALNIFRPLISRIPVYAGYTSDLVLKTAFALRETGKFQEAEGLTDEALLFYPDYPDLLELKATLCLDREKPPEALEVIGQALQYGDRSLQYTTSSGSGSYRSHYLAGMILERMFLWKEAIEHYRKALDFNPGYGPAWRRLAIIILMLGDAEELDLSLRRLESVPPFAHSIWFETAIDFHRTDVAMKLSEQPCKAKINPIHRAVMYAQLDDNELASSILLPLLESLQFHTDAALYLWVLSMKQEDVAAGMRRLTQLSIRDSAFSAMEAMLQELPLRSFPVSPYRRCQLALLRCGAWKTYITLLPPPPFDRRIPWLPEGGMAGFLTAPAAYRHKMLERCQTRTVLMDFSELIAAGVIAHSLEDYFPARDWFAAARNIKPDRLEPLVGMAACYADAARGLCSMTTQLQTDVSMCMIVP